MLLLTRLPVQFDTWVWKVPVGHVMETKIGLLVSGGERDQLRFSLLKKSSPSGDQLWPSVPIIFALNRESGKVQHFDQTLPDKELERVVQSLAQERPPPTVSHSGYYFARDVCGYLALWRAYWLHSRQTPKGGMD